MRIYHVFYIDSFDINLLYSGGIDFIFHIKELNVNEKTPRTKLLAPCFDYKTGFYYS